MAYRPKRIRLVSDDVKSLENLAKALNRILDAQNIELVALRDEVDTLKQRIDDYGIPP